MISERLLIKMPPTARDFKEFLKKALKENSKTSWGKNELALFIEETYSEFVEGYLEG